MKTNVIKPKYDKSETITAWLFLLPGLILLGIFVFYPILFSIPISFFDYSIIDKTKFVGLDNFKRAFTDPDFGISVINSLKYLIIVPVIQLFSILLAVLINNKIKGIKLYRSAFFMPYVTSMVAVAIIWGWLFNQDGLINQMLMRIGLMSTKVAWLSDSKTALGACMFVTVWKGLGYYMVIYLAGLQGVPKELEEAAMVDGATRWQSLKNVTIPLLKPYVLFCTLMSVMGAIRVFDEVFVLTNGGPGVATLTTSLFTYKKAFVQFDFGYASAIGLLVSIVVAALSIGTFEFNKKGGVNPY